MRNPTEAQKPAAQPAPTTGDAGYRKASRQTSADRRAQLQPLKKTISALEARLEKGQKALDALQTQLADGDLYIQSAGDELAELLKQEGQLKRELEEIESEWLEQQEALEALERAAY